MRLDITYQEISLLRRVEVAKKVISQGDGRGWEKSLKHKGRFLSQGNAALRRLILVTERDRVKCKSRGRKSEGTENPYDQGSTGSTLRKTQALRGECAKDHSGDGAETIPQQQSIKDDDGGGSIPHKI